jgi:hypothetical protein
VSTLSWGDIAQVVIAVSALYGAWRGYQNAAKIQEVHLSINSRMDELLKSSSEAARAAGAIEERNRDK